VYGKHLGADSAEPVPPAEESDLQSRMAEFLASPRSSGMPNELRVVAVRWAQGQTQMEIAQELRIVQATVSRRLEEAKTWLYRRRPAFIVEQLCLPAKCTVGGLIDAHHKGRDTLLHDGRRAALSCRT
jgi:hypothetical protein